MFKFDQNQKKVIASEVLCSLRPFFIQSITVKSSQLFIKVKITNDGASVDEVDITVSNSFSKSRLDYLSRLWVELFSQNLTLPMTTSNTAAPIYRR